MLGKVKKFFRSDDLSHLTEKVDSGLANQSELLNEKLSTLIAASDNQSKLLTEKLSALIEASDNQSKLLNDKLSALIQRE